MDGLREPPPQAKVPYRPAGRRPPPSRALPAAAGPQPRLESSLPGPQPEVSAPPPARPAARGLGAHSLRPDASACSLAHMAHSICPMVTEATTARRDPWDTAACAAAASPSGGRPRPLPRPSAPPPVGGPVQPGRWGTPLGRPRGALGESRDPSVGCPARPGPPSLTGSPVGPASPPPGPGPGSDSLPPPGSFRAGGGGHRPSPWLCARPARSAALSRHHPGCLGPA